MRIMFIKLYNSLKWSLSGLYECFKAEKSFRLEVSLLLITCVFGFLFKISFIQFLILISIVILMMAFELINSAIERLADLISSEYNPVIKYIKDVGSAAVFLCLIIYCIGLIYIYVH